MKKEIVSIIDEPKSETVARMVPQFDADGEIILDGEGQPVLIEHQETRTWTEKRQVSTLVDMTPEEIAAFEIERAPDLTAYAAARRWAREVGGCVVDGHQVATDRDSQSKYLAEFVAISAGMRADPSPWKFADGEFVMLTNAAMATVIMGVRAHVSGAFGLEMTVLAGIAAGTVTTTAQIDAAF